MDFAPEKYASAVVRLGPERVHVVEQTTEIAAMVAKEIVVQALQPVLAKLEELERLKKSDRSNSAIVQNLMQRLASVEARPFPTYKGVWSEGVYQKTNFVSFDGSLWWCHRDTSAKPGSSPDWQLCAKKGKDLR